MRSTLFADPYVLAGAALLVGALACAALADRVRVPGLLFFLGLGMLVGDDGLDLISLSEPRVVQAAGVVALLVILSEGGLSTKPTDLRRAALPGMALATIGTLVTAGVVALGVWAILDVDSRRRCCWGRWWPPPTRRPCSACFVRPRCQSGWARCWRSSPEATTRWPSP